MGDAAGVTVICGTSLTTQTAGTSIKAAGATY